MSYPWLEKRMKTMYDDTPPSKEVLDALKDVLNVLSEDYTLPEPEVLYSARDSIGVAIIELSWKTVGLIITPTYIVMFRPVLQRGEKFDFELPRDKEELKKAVHTRLVPS